MRHGNAFIHACMSIDLVAVVRFSSGLSPSGRNDPLGGSILATIRLPFSEHRPTEQNTQETPANNGCIIAACLNTLGIPTGSGPLWLLPTAHVVHNAFSKTKNRTSTLRQQSNHRRHPLPKNSAEPPAVRRRCSTNTNPRDRPP